MNTPNAERLRSGLQQLPLVVAEEGALLSKLMIAYQLNYLIYGII